MQGFLFFENRAKSLVLLEREVGLYVEQAELYKKYIGLFEEAFNEKS
ncbi:MAG: hypothetical protein Q4B34_03090 [Candidatus Saccharibacteria bacterium]|nr:hypothetical protein [Candidatus Saccharibacteria bacterium]